MNSRILDILERWADVRTIFEVIEESVKAIEIDGPHGLYVITKEKASNIQYLCMTINCESDPDLPNFIFDEIEEVMKELKSDNEYHRESWRTTAQHYEVRGDEIEAKKAWNWCKYHDDIVEQCKKHVQLE